MSDNVSACLLIVVNPCFFFTRDSLLSCIFKKRLVFGHNVSSHKFEPEILSQWLHLYNENCVFMHFFWNVTDLRDHCFAVHYIICSWSGCKHLFIFPFFHAKLCLLSSSSQYYKPSVCTSWFVHCLLIKNRKYSIAGLLHFRRTCQTNYTVRLRLETELYFLNYSTAVHYFD